MAQYVGRSNTLARGIADSREVRQQPYWAQVDVNTTADLRLFTNVPATAVLGNMQVAGQFPAPKQALIYGISCYLPPDTPLADAVEIMGNAAGTTGRVVVFRIADKEDTGSPAAMSTASAESLVKVASPHSSGGYVDTKRGQTVLMDHLLRYFQLPPWARLPTRRTRWGIPFPGAWATAPDHRGVSS